MKKFIIVAAISIALAGCQTALPQSAIDSQRAMPAKRKAQIVRFVKESSTQLFNLHSIRDAEVSDVMMIDQKNHVELFCIKFYSKVFKQKSGKWSVSDMPIIINLIDGKSDTHSVCQDPRIKYHPFPELENLKRL